jgi:hypothetical protein
MPPGISWTDLKDFMNKEHRLTALFTSTRVSSNGTTIGVVEFPDEDAMSAAMAKLVDARFRGTTITVERETAERNWVSIGGGAGGGAAAPPAPRARSRSRSRERGADERAPRHDDERADERHDERRDDGAPPPAAE